MEKRAGDGACVNGGYSVLEPSVIDHVEDHSTVWQQEPLRRLAHAGELQAFRHGGVWYLMDSMQDRDVLGNLWASGSARESLDRLTQRPPPVPR